jgi:signal transduction histidine kinase
VVEAVAAEALTELENARLRAAITLQLVEVRASRARIAAAQLAERRKIERNLHDGAQQRLLALALQLRAAEVNQNPERVRAALGGAVDGLQLAIQDLRDLANGLLPASLADGGLAAAFEDLVSRTPVPVKLRATERRYPVPIEETAWFITCEAVANAVKHAAPCSVEISVEQAGDRLRLVIEDDGLGGADPRGSGLRGIADRAEAVGGCLTVGELPGRGTIITAELPCAS